MKPERRQAPPLVTAALVAANVAVYGAELAGDGQAICETYGLVPARLTTSGDLGPLVTHLFLHDPNSITHIGGNLVFLAVFGAIVERSLGHLRFAALYLTAGVAGALVHVLVDPSSTTPMVGASGALFGLLAVAAVIRPRLCAFVAPLFAYQIWGIFAGTGEGVSCGAHIGGFCAGAFVVVYLHVAGTATTNTRFLGRAREGSWRVGRMTRYETGRRPWRVPPHGQT